MDMNLSLGYEMCKTVHFYFKNYMSTWQEANDKDHDQQCLQVECFVRNQNETKSITNGLANSIFSTQKYSNKNAKTLQT